MSDRVGAGRVLIAVGAATGIVMMLYGAYVHRNSRMASEPVLEMPAKTEKRNRQPAAGVGQDKVPMESSAASDVQAKGDTPQAVLHAYIAALEAHNVDPALSIYTEATKKMFAEWVVTPAQMDNEAKNYRRCRGEEVRMQGDLAVVRFDVKQRQCSPYFLRREGGGWKLDFTMMQTAISFNVDNEWRLKPEVPHDYGFAFTDWRFDSHGFPHPGKDVE